MTFTRLFLACTLCCAITPFTYAESSASSSAPTHTGSGADLWQAREGRAEGFLNRYTLFSTTRNTNWKKQEKMREKLIMQIQKCRDDLRRANRDTLAPVTLQCYRGQLLLEQQALKQERGIVEALPGLSEDGRTELLQRIDAFISALQTVIDGIDVKVFHTVADLKDVRKNLLTQYRQPYWLAKAHLRADEALTWVAHLLLKLRLLSADSSLAQGVAEKLPSLLTCYAHAESLLTTTMNASGIDEAKENYDQAATLLATCAQSLDEALLIQHTAEEKL